MKTKIKQYMYLYLKSLNFVWKSCPWLCFVLICIVPVQALIPSASLYFTNLIINSLQSNATAKISVFLVIWCVFFVLNNLMTPLNTFVQGQLTDKLTLFLNTQIMKKSETIQDISCFEDNEFYNKVNLLSSEASWRPVNLLVFGTSIISNFIMLVSMFILLANFNIWIAIILFIAMLLQGSVSYKIQQQAFETLMSNTEDSRKLTYYSEVLLTAEYIKDVRLYNLYSFFQNKYKLTYEQIRAAVQKNRIRQFLVSALFLIVSGTFSAFCFSYVITGVQSELYEIGSIMIFTSAILYSIQGITRLVEDSSLLYDTLLYMENLFAYLATDVKDKGKGKAVPENFNEIVFNDVSFSYRDSERNAIDHVNFKVKKGEKIAIVGENGAGKSTLMKLLLNLYSKDNGNILFDENVVEDMDMIEYRKKFAAVFQDFAQFDLTLKENIVLSDLENNENQERFLYALNESNIDMKDMGLNENQELGKKFENGRELSGGQWQRVALARAFFSKADILVLDEPTSALDARTEKYVFDKFYELSKEKTVFFVTHRLATVRKADKILLLKDGKICGFDKHDKMLQENEYYSELYHLQADMFEIE